MNCWKEKTQFPLTLNENLWQYRDQADRTPIAELQVVRAPDWATHFVEQTESVFPCCHLYLRRLCSGLVVRFYGSSTIEGSGISRVHPIFPINLGKP